MSLRPRAPSRPRFASVPSALVALGLLLATPTAATSTHPLTLDGPGPAATAATAATTPAPSTLASPAPDTLRVRIVPEHLELAHMAESQLAVEVVEPAGATFDAAGLVWYSQDPEVVFVGPGGVVRARSAGRTRISVVVDGQVAVAVVEVLPPTPARLELELPVTELAAGTSAPLTVRGWSEDGEPLTPAGLRFSSANPSVVRVDADGRVHGVSPGPGVVTAYAGEVSATVALRVGERPEVSWVIEPAGTTVRTGDVVRFRLRSEGAGGAASEWYPAWSVSASGASVEEEGAEGVFVAEEPGSYRVTATLGDEASRSVLVEVEPRERAALIVQAGRGVLHGHHSGDMWVFEGSDGRDYVYIGTFQHDWMKVFDVTDPANPILTDSLWMDARRINDVKGNARGDILVATREGASDRRNGIVILDASDPAHPRIASEYTETVTGGVHNVWIEGDLVYASHNGTSDMHIIDISDPENPHEVGRWGLERERKTLHDAMVQEGYAYLSYWDDGVVMLDVGAGTHGGTPTEPAFVSRFSYPSGHTHTAWRDGRYLFVGDEIFPMDWDPSGPIEARGYIHVLDMIDPENPVEVARYEVPEAGVHNFWVEDELLYVGYYQAGIRVVDISGELRGDLYRQGRELAALKTTDEHTMAPNWPMTWGAQPFKGYIFSSDLNSGLWITRLELGERVVF